MTSARPIEAIVRERVVAFLKQHEVGLSSGYEEVRLRRVRALSEDELRRLVQELGIRNYNSGETGQLSFLVELEQLVFECLGRSGVRVQLQER